jgi:hypothetical protein
MLTEAKCRQQAENMSGRSFHLVDKYTKFLSNILRWTNNWPAMREVLLEQLGISEDLMPPVALESVVACSLQETQRRARLCVSQHENMEQACNTKFVHPDASTGNPDGGLIPASDKDANGTLEHAIQVSNSNDQARKRSVAFAASASQRLASSPQDKSQLSAQGSAPKPALKTFVYRSLSVEERSTPQHTANAFRSWSISEKSDRQMPLRSESLRKPMRHQHIQNVILAIMSAFIEPYASHN